MAEALKIAVIKTISRLACAILSGTAMGLADTEPVINHESDRNSSSFTTQLWLWLGFSPQTAPMVS